MAEMCNDCGLPQELCVCTDMDRSDSPEVEIYVEERRYNKEMTIIEGVATDDVDELSSEIKSAVGAGGTTDASEGRIEIQGDHKDKERVHNLLRERGYELMSN